MNDDDFFSAPETTCTVSEPRPDIQEDDFMSMEVNSVQTAPSHHPTQHSSNPEQQASTVEDTLQIRRALEMEHQRLIEERRLQNQTLKGNQGKAASAFWAEQRTQRSALLESRSDANQHAEKEAKELRNVLFTKGTLWQRVQSMTSTSMLSSKSVDRAKKQTRIREILALMTS